MASALTPGTEGKLPGLSKPWIDGGGGRFGGEGGGGVRVRSIRHFVVTAAVDGDLLVVGAPLEDSYANGLNAGTALEASNVYTNAGAAYVFLRAASKWRQIDYVKASNTDFGDWFGDKVAVSKDTVVVGAPLEASDGVGVNSKAGGVNGQLTIAAGTAYVFR